MGFRDIHTLNLALLAKRCSRLLTTPNNLVAQILKARYIIHGGICISLGSVYWRYHLVADGGCMGDRSKTRIWKTRKTNGFTHLPTTYRVISPKPPDTTFQLVTHAHLHEH